MKLVIGLGNPGKEYQRTRHNAGFLLIDYIISNFEFPESKLDKKTTADTSKGELEGKRILLAKPQTFMNNSGLAVKALVQFYKLTPDNIIIVHDDKDIPLGETRVQKNRGAAGHNGVASIIQELGTQDFTRIRIGVATGLLAHDGQGQIGTADFVLGKFTADEQKKLKAVFTHVMEEIRQLL